MGYTFCCENCKYEVKEILLGRGKIDATERVLGTCKNCKILFATKDKSCVKCKTKYHRFAFVQPVKLYFKQKEYKNVKCPSCNEKSLIAKGHIFWD